MYPLFETIRVENGVPMHLDWHQKRMEESCMDYFEQKPSLDLEKIIVVPEPYRKGVVKARLLYNTTEYSLSFAFYTPRNVRSLCLAYDNIINYNHKYSDRKRLTVLLEQSGICDDILIIKNNMVTDTSFTNIIFYNGDKWVTPDTPLLKGTCRERLLYANKISEATIRKEDIQDYDQYMLINAMLDFDPERALDIRSIRM